jgi:glutamyl/glutaminyl-tRNA synthetase
MPVNMGRDAPAVWNSRHFGKTLFGYAHPRMIIQKQLELPTYNFAPRS